MNRRRNTNGRLTAVRARPRQGLMRPGKFIQPPMDPPPAFKSGWKDIRLSLGIGSTSVSITEKTIYDTLVALGITPNSYRLYKMAVWVVPAPSASGSVPRVILSVRDPIGTGTLGTREDGGQLSRAACVAYSYSESIREIALDFPTPGQAGRTLASVETALPAGEIQVSIAYNV